MTKDFDTIYAQTMKAPLPPTPARFQEQHMFNDKDNASSVYCRIFKRAKGSSKTKSKGQKMEEYWNDLKQREAFNKCWTRKRPRSIMGKIDTDLAVKTRSMTANMVKNLTASVTQSVTALNASMSSERSGQTTTTEDSSYVYQSERSSNTEDKPQRPKRARVEPSRWDGQGSFELEVDTVWTQDDHDMSSLLLEYAKEYLEVGTSCPDRPSKVAMNRIFFLEPKSTLEDHLGTAGSSLFAPIHCPRLEAQDVVDIYNVGLAFGEKDSTSTQEYIFAEWARQRPTSDLLRRLVTHYAQVEALWTRPDQRNEDSYLHDYFMPIFNCLQRPGLIRHLTSTFEPSQTRSQAFDPSNHGIKSDLHFVIKGSHLFVCEGKRPGVNSRYDFEKTSLEMKDAIDHGVGQGKRLMTVFGCQVKDGKGELFRMELKSESIYLMKPVGSFVHPDGNDDMTRVLLHNLPLLLWLSRELDVAIEVMDQDGHELQDWIRPSFELPR